MGLYALNKGSSFIVAEEAKKEIPWHIPNKCLEAKTVQVSHWESCLLPLHCSLSALTDCVFADHFDS